VRRWQGQVCRLVVACCLRRPMPHTRGSLANKINVICRRHQFWRQHPRKYICRLSQLCAPSQIGGRPVSCVRFQPYGSQRCQPRGDGRPQRKKDICRPRVVRRHGCTSNHAAATCFFHGEMVCCPRCLHRCRGNSHRYRKVPHQLRIRGRPINPIRAQHFAYHGGKVPVIVSLTPRQCYTRSLLLKTGYRGT